MKEIVIAKTDRKKCTICGKKLKLGECHACFYSRANVCSDCLHQLHKIVEKKNEETCLDKLWEAIFQLQVEQNLLEKCDFEAHEPGLYKHR